MQLLESVQDQGARRYSTSDLIGSGFPVTWQARIYGDMLERDHERVMARALKLSA